MHYTGAKPGEGQEAWAQQHIGLDARDPNIIACE